MSILRKLQEFFRKYPVIFAGILYFFIAIIFTFPLVARISSEIPAGRGDVFQAMANIDSRVAAMSSLTFSEKAVFLAKNINVYLPYVVMNMFVNKYIAYNIMFLASFMLSGIGMYLLAMYFIGNARAAFLSGLIFAFCPFHFYEATVVNLGTMHQEWLPFLALCLFRFFEKLEIKYFLATAFFALLIALEEHQMLAFSALFILMVAIYRIWLDRSILKNKKFWTYVASSLGLLAIVAFGMFGTMLKVATSDNNFLNAGANSANRYSIKMLDPLMPPIFHSIWPKFGAFMQNMILGDTNRGSYFIGFSVTAMLIWGVYLLRKKMIEELAEKSYRDNLVFWSASSLLFYVFSLGISFSIGKTTIYLPYFLIYKFLPFYENIRTTGRMFVFAMMGIAMLCTYAYVQLEKRYASRKMVAVAVFSTLVLLEFWVAPISTMAVGHSAFYDRIAKDGGTYGLIEIPGSTSYEFASYAMITDVIHHKKVFNGMPLARKISGQFDMQQGTPVIKQLLYTIPKGNDPDDKDDADIINPFDYGNSNDVLNYYNIRYITISKIYADDGTVRLAQNFIEKHVASLNRYEDDYLIAYEVAKKDPVGIFWELKGDNGQFSRLVKDKNGGFWREMGDGATLRVVNMSSQEQQVTVSVTAQSRSGLVVSSPFDAMNNSSVSNGTDQQYSFVTILKPGENMITFSVKDASGNAVKNSGKKKSPTGSIVTRIDMKY